MHCLTGCGLLTWEGHEPCVGAGSHLRAARSRQLQQRLGGGMQRVFRGLGSCELAVHSLTGGSDLTRNSGCECPACREKQQQTTRTAVQDRRAAEDAEEDRAEEEMLAKLASEQEAVRKAEADRLKVRVPMRCRPPQDEGMWAVRGWCSPVGWPSCVVSGGWG